MTWRMKSPLRFFGTLAVTGGLLFVDWRLALAFFVGVGVGSVETERTLAVERWDDEEG